MQTDGHVSLRIHGEDDLRVLPDGPAGQREALPDGRDLGAADLHVDVLICGSLGVALGEEGEAVGAGLQMYGLRELHRAAVGVVEVDALAAAVRIVAGTAAAREGIHAHVGVLKAGVLQQIGGQHGDRGGGLGGAQLIGEGHRAGDRVDAHSIHVHRGQGLGVPFHGLVFAPAHVVGDLDGLGQGKGAALLQGDLHSLYRFNLLFDQVLGADHHVLPGPERIQHLAAKVEHGLVVHGGSAEPPSRVVGIVFRGIGGGPAGAELLPLCLVGGEDGIVQIPLRVIGILDGDPGVLPVEHADAGLAHGGDGLGGRHQFISLALNREGICVAAVVVAGADGVVPAVSVVQSPGPGGFRYHDLLAVGVCHLLENGGQIFRGAVPVGIPGGGKDVVVYVVAVQVTRLGGIVVGSLRVGEVNRHQDRMLIFRGDLTNGRRACGEDLRLVGPAGFAADGIGGLVADLDHAHVNAAVQQGLQAVVGEGVHCLDLLVNRESRPGLWSLLLAGIRPEVGIMEVNQDLHARVGGPLAHLQGGVDVTVAAAVAVALGVKGIVPDPKPDIVEACACQQVKEALAGQLAAIVVIELGPGVDNGEIGGNVGASHEIRGVHAADLLHCHRGGMVQLDLSRGDGAGADKLQVVQVRPVPGGNGAREPEGDFRRLGEGEFLHRGGEPDVPAAGGDVIDQGQGSAVLVDARFELAVHVFAVHVEGEVIGARSQPHRVPGRNGDGLVVAGPDVQNMGGVLLGGAVVNNPSVKADSEPARGAIFEVAVGKRDLGGFDRLCVVIDVPRRFGGILCEGGDVILFRVQGDIAGLVPFESAVVAVRPIVRSGVGGIAADQNHMIPGACGNGGLIDAAVLQSEIGPRVFGAAEEIGLLCGVVVLPPCHGAEIDVQLLAAVVGFFRGKNAGREQADCHDDRQQDCQYAFCSVLLHTDAILSYILHRVIVVREKYGPRSP